MVEKSENDENLDMLAKESALIKEAWLGKETAAGKQMDTIEGSEGAAKRDSPKAPYKEKAPRKEREFGLWKFKFRIKNKMLILIIMNSILVGGILTINYLMLRESASLFSSINLIAMFIFIFPIIMIKYTEYKKLKELEELFPVFLRDFVGSIRGGMTIPHALKSITRNDYKGLNPYVRKMAAQLDWGIPVETVLMKFAKESRSKLIGRIISSVRESHRFGGNLADTLEALSNTAVEVEHLREERRLYLHSQMITGYIVFFVFLAVMIGLEKFLVPSLSEVSTGLPGAEVAPRVNLATEYNAIFRNLILIQGLFAGLSTGKMAEGAVIAGLKHSLFMMFIGALIFTIAG